MSMTIRCTDWVIALAMALLIAPALKAQAPGQSSASQNGVPGANQPSNSLQEIVVTAQKREERLIDVPISVAVLTGKELQERNASSLNDLMFAVPGMGITTQGVLLDQIEIRGISNFAGNWATVGMYLDEADISGALGGQPNLNAYDLKRIEVLRGPQGTLFGEGSSGGTIRFITNDPALDVFAMNTDVTATFTENGAPSQRVNAMINTPLVADELGLRLVSTFERDGGWINQPAADRSDINGADITDIRLKGLWRPTGQLTVNALAEINRTTGSPGTEDPIPGTQTASGKFTQTFSLTTSPTVRADHDIYNLTLTYDFPAIRLLETTTYVTQYQNEANSGFLVPIAPPPTPAFEEYLNPLINNYDSLTQEIRVSSSTSEPWQWTVGAMYRWFSNRGIATAYFAPPGPLPANPGFSAATDLSSNSGAAFVNSSYKLVDRLTLGVGVRFFRDREQSSGFDYIANAAVAKQSAVFQSTDPRIYLQFEPTANANVYTSAAKGFRSGGFNSVGLPTFGPETVWTYELGAKTTLLDGRLSADADIYYSRYTEYQVQSLVFLANNQPTSATTNGGNAWIKGIEWALAWHPTRQWSLSFSGNWLDTEFYEVPPGSSYAVGDQLDYVPKYSLVASIKRDFIFGRMPGFVRVDYSQQGPQTIRNRQIGDFYYDESNPVHMLNASASLSVSDTLRLGLFAQNLTNDRNFTTAYAIQNFASANRPRAYGVEFGYSL